MHFELPRLVKFAHDQMQTIVRYHSVCYIYVVVIGAIMKQRGILARSGSYVDHDTSSRRTLV